MKLSSSFLAVLPLVTLVASVDIDKQRYHEHGKIPHAHFIECSAARPYSFSKEEAEKTIYDLKHHAGNFINKQGNNYLVDGRRIWYGKAFWTDLGQALDHCKWACLMPAMTWGFDAAYCRLRTDAQSEEDHRITVGYTNSELQRCYKGRGSKDRMVPCYEAFEIPMDKRDSTWRLQRHDGGIPDTRDIWQFPYADDGLNIKNQTFCNVDNGCLGLWNPHVYVDREGDPPDPDKKKAWDQLEGIAAQPGVDPNKKKAWDQIWGIATGTWPGRRE